MLALFDSPQLRNFSYASTLSYLDGYITIPNMGHDMTIRIPGMLEL